jgi:hypothetical protein
MEELGLDEMSGVEAALRRGGKVLVFGAETQQPGLAGQFEPLNLTTSHQGALYQLPFSKLVLSQTCTAASFTTDSNVPLDKKGYG